MKIVTEDYAETLGVARERSGNALVAAVIGQVLRRDLDEDFELPAQFLAMVRILDRLPEDQTSQSGPG
ncbi:hypothetical protein [Methylobacterium aerolatum]|uniref:Uncharacterized protein n=1 Tax=Methylobacterium aerolatum TaxID=418708 RepID=A0ABU0I616_9HYPH|nr:hypothetical protein [Methylobacterium aerolatum]MDQ0449069.1 hypothetical protein [Methylobacterium aerolatum]GJD35257.1 hypothetical protein FMGBMHLM_2166 [Methylobacterium aerolatum]